jgi:bifunctional DNase/RNase
VSDPVAGQVEVPAPAHTEPGPPGRPAMEPAADPDRAEVAEAAEVPESSTGEPAVASGSGGTDQPVPGGGIDQPVSAGGIDQPVPEEGPDQPVREVGLTAEVSTPDPGMPQFSMALVSAISVDLPNQHPTVVLRETESPRRQLSFSIGLPDAVVLSHAMRRIPTPRPLTPELLSGILQGFDIDVVAVRLVGRQGSIYFAELDLQGRTGRSVHSCRPSDGLTVALLQPVPVPILIDRRLLELDGDVAPPGPATTST